MRFEELFGVNDFRCFAIMTNNYCNLHCEHCTNLCDIPLRKDNENIYRRTPWEISLHDLEVFCQRFEGIGEENWHRLTGGEFTMLHPGKAEDIIETLASYGRRMDTRTNGFGLLDIGETQLKKLDRIILSDHGINHQQIASCKAWLKSFFKGEIIQELVDHHWDVRAARGHRENQGRQCRFWLTTPLFHSYSGVIHPCCNTNCLMYMNNDTEMDDQLLLAGWTIFAEDLIPRLMNWKMTIPPYVLDQCENHCWYPHIDLGKRTKITRKKNDNLYRPRIIYRSGLERKLAR